MMENTRFQTKAEDFDLETTQKAQLIYKIITYLPFILVALLLILLVVVMLLVPGFKAKFVFPGIQIVLNGITWLLIKFSMTPQLGSIVASIKNQEYYENNEAMNNLFSSSMSSIFGSILEDVLARIGVVALLALGAGIVLTVLSVVLKPKEVENNKKEEKTINKSEKTEKG